VENEAAGPKQTLLEYGFKNFSTVEAVKKGTSFGPVKVRRGKEGQLTLTAAEDTWVTVGKGKEKSVVASPQLPPSVVAPIQKGQSLAKVVVRGLGGSVLGCLHGYRENWIHLADLVVILGGLESSTSWLLVVRRSSQKFDALNGREN
jgi:D-alanyl-D-alanine carboxypeptidase